MEAVGTTYKIRRAQGNKSDAHTFLGCTHRRTKRTVEGRVLQCMEYDSSGQLRRAVVKYKEVVQQLTGMEPQMKKVSTPYIQEETKKSLHRAPIQSGKFVECPCCMHTFPETDARQHTFDAGPVRKVQVLHPPITKDNLTRHDDDDQYWNTEASDMICGVVKTHIGKEAPWKKQNRSNISSTTDPGDDDNSISQDSTSTWGDEDDDGDQW